MVIKDGLTLDALQWAVLCPNGEGFPWVHLHQDHLYQHPHPHTQNNTIRKHKETEMAVRKWTKWHIMAWIYCTCLFRDNTDNQALCRTANRLTEVTNHTIKSQSTDEREFTNRSEVLHLRHCCPDFTNQGVWDVGMKLIVRDLLKQIYSNSTQMLSGMYHNETSLERWARTKKAK